MPGFKSPLYLSFLELEKRAPWASLLKMAPEAGISSGAIARSAAQRRGPGAREPVKEKRLSERKVYKLPNAYCSTVIADPGRALPASGIGPVLPTKQTASGWTEIAGKIPSG